MSEIEYFYSAHSAFAYLGSARFMEIARAAGRTIAHRPVDLLRVMVESGAGSTRERGASRRSSAGSRGKRQRQQPRRPVVQQPIAVSPWPR